MSLKYEPALEPLHISCVGRMGLGTGNASGEALWCSESRLLSSTLEVTQGQILSQSPTDPTSKPQMLSLRGSICMGVDKRNYRFAPGLPPGRYIVQPIHERSPVGCQTRLEYWNAQRTPGTDIWSGIHLAEHRGTQVYTLLRGRDSQGRNKHQPVVTCLGAASLVNAEAAHTKPETRWRGRG